MDSKYPFIHLHNHTEYSLLDGSIRINELLEKTAEYGMDTVAITDHGNMFGSFQFYRSAKKKGIKPVIGCEVYVTNSDNPKQDRDKDDIYHLVLLVKDEAGYKNLIDMVTNSYLEGFYHKPLISKSYLAQKTRGLIGLSACLKGEIAVKIAKNVCDDSVMDLLDYYRSIFSYEDFYLELQDNGIILQDKINSYYIDINRKYKVPLVATNDVHYLEKDDWVFHNALLCIGTGKSVNNMDRIIFPKTLYFKTPEEMWKSFRQIPSALTNTLEIAEKCCYDFDTSNYHLPQFPLPEGYTEDSYLESIAREGFKKKISRNIQEKGSKDGYSLSIYEERLAYEIKVIQTTHFSGYMLIVWDILSFCRKNNIGVGPGRGSAVGSLLCYCLDITEVDPIPFGLIFERFLNPDRTSLPDIDIDICQEKRSNVISYLSERYGKENVTQIITFSKLASKAAIKDVARVYDLPFDKANEITKLFPDESPDIQSALSSSSEFRDRINADETLKEIMNISQKVEGLTRHVSVHAAGIVIADKAVSSYIPLYATPKTPVCTQFEFRYLENLGLLKMDLLGLKTITLIDKIIDLVHKKSQQEIVIEKIPLDDENTFKLLASGNTCGVFQLESKGMQTLLTQAKPENFADIMPLLALYRPGPLGQKMNDVYIDGRKGRSKVRYNIAELGDILSETYGVILYQEQVMKIANVIGGFSLSEADILRKAMGKKQQKLMDEMKPKFIDNAVKKGYPVKDVEELFSKMERFAEYGFNKSHSAGYSYITYRTAYLKANYTPFFFSALMSLDSNDKKKILKYINDCKIFNIKIMPPDINISEEDFTVEGEKIIFGLIAISNVGRNAISSILKARISAGKFKDLYHFCECVDLKKVNKRVIENLIKSGAFDNISSHSRKENLYLLENAVEKGQSKKLQLITGQRSLFDSANAKTNSCENIIPKIPDDFQPETQMEKLNYEYEALSYFISDHPITGYSEILRRLNVCRIESVLEDNNKNDTFKISGVINSIELKRTKSAKTYANIILEDLSGICDVILFPDLYEQKKEILKPMIPLVVTGSRDNQDQSANIIAKDICTLDTYISKRIEFIDLLLNYDTINKTFCRDLESIISRYPGDRTMRLIVKHKNKRIIIRPHPAYCVSYNPNLMQNITNLLKKEDDESLILSFSSNYI